MNPSRESDLVRTFVELADTLVADFDVVEFLHLLTTRCRDLLDVAETGLLLADAQGSLHVMSSSSERTRLLELFQLQIDEGPCLECYESGAPVASEDLDADRDRWPVFTPAARAAGFASVQAVPLRLRQEIIGAMNLFRAVTGRLTDADIQVAQAMADVATIGILQQRAVHEGQTTVTQLQEALTSRIVIEQAKGMLAERAGIDTDEAFKRLRSHARDHNRRLSDVAHDLLDANLDAAAFAGAADDR